MKKCIVRSVLVTLLAMTLIIPTLSGCSGNVAKTSSTGSTAATGQKVTLNVLSQRVEDKSFYDSLTKAFEAKYPNITLKVDLIPTAQYPTVLTTRIASDSVDVCVHQAPSPVAEQTWWLNLAGQPFLKNDYQENLDAEFEVGIDPPGAVYDVPCMGTTFETFYNKDMFSKNGLSVPTTWNELIACCDKLKAAGVTPFLFGGKDQWPVNCILDAMGPPLVQAVNPTFFETLNTGKTKFTDPDFLNVITRMNKLFTYCDKNSLGIAYADAPGLFAQGKCAMYIDGNWSSAQIEAAKPSFDVGVFLTPTSDDAAANQTATVRNGMGWSIVHSTTHKTEALEFLSFLFQPENQKAQCDISGTLPTGPNYTVSDSLSNASASLINNSKLKVGCFEAQPSRYTPGCTFTSTYTAYLINMFAGQLTPEQVVEKMQKDFDGSKSDWQLTSSK